MSRGMHYTGAGELPPRLINRDNAPLAVEQGDVRGQRVEDGGLPGGFAVTHVFLGAPQEYRPSLAVGHRIDFARRQLIQALLRFVERLDQGGNFLILIRRQGEYFGAHATCASGSTGACMPIGAPLFGIEK